MVITAKAPTEEAAVKWADAAAEQARAQALGMLAAPIGLEEAKITRLEARTASLEKEIGRVRALSAKVTDPQVQATYLSLHQHSGDLAG